MLEVVRMPVKFIGWGSGNRGITDQKKQNPAVDCGRVSVTLQATRAVVNLC
jgi:hypothetical protein